MLTLDDYLDLAKARNDLTSDRALSRDIGGSSATIHFYRRGVHKPSPDTMIKIADLCGINPAQALLDLAIWTSESERAASIYKDIYKAITRSAAALVLAVILAAGLAGKTEAGTLGELTTTADRTLYIMGNWIRRLLRAFDLIAHAIVLDTPRVSG